MPGRHCSAAVDGRKESAGHERWAKVSVDAAATLRRLIARVHQQSVSETAAAAAARLCQLTIKATK